MSGRRHWMPKSAKRLRSTDSRENRKPKQIFMNARRMRKLMRPNRRLPEFGQRVKRRHLQSRQKRSRKQRVLKRKQRPWRKWVRLQFLKCTLKLIRKLQGSLPNRYPRLIPSLCTETGIRLN